MQQQTTHPPRNPDSRITPNLANYRRLFDDRHHCRDCRRLWGVTCLLHNVRPVDDIPRRCSGFILNDG